MYEDEFLFNKKKLDLHTLLVENQNASNNNIENVKNNNTIINLNNDNDNNLNFDATNQKLFKYIKKNLTEKNNQNIIDLKLIITTKTPPTTNLETLLTTLTTTINNINKINLFNNESLKQNFNEINLEKIDNLLGKSLNKSINSEIVTTKNTNAFVLYDNESHILEDNSNLKKFGKY